VRLKVRPVLDPVIPVVRGPVAVLVRVPSPKGSARNRDTPVAEPAPARVRVNPEPVQARFLLVVRAHGPELVN
jgi:hypothetical protein